MGKIKYYTTEQEDWLRTNVEGKAYNGIKELTDAFKLFDKIW